MFSVPFSKMVKQTKDELYVYLLTSITEATPITIATIRTATVTPAYTPALLPDFGSSPGFN